MSDEIPVAEEFRPEVRAVVEVLNAHEVEYVMVGGAALQAHGVPHVTDDTDVVIALGPENEAPLGRALEALHASELGRGTLGVTFITTHGKLDVLEHTSGRGDYDAWSADSQTVQLGRGGPLVRVGAIDGIKLDKTTARRDKDIDALETIARFERGDQSPAELLLGSRPLSEPLRGRRWDMAAVALEHFRRKYGIDSPEPLGLGEAAPGMQEEREKLLRLAERLAPAPELDGPAPGHDLEP